MRDLIEINGMFLMIKEAVTQCDSVAGSLRGELKEAWICWGVMQGGYLIVGCIHG